MPSFYTQKPVPKENKTRRLTPSVYSQEMSLSTEERFANTKEVHPPRILELMDMSMTTHQKMSMVDMDQALFQPYPSELIFQNVIPTHIYKLQLRLFNVDKVPRRVKVELQESEYFSVVGPENSLSKVAPCRSVTFTVFFKPQEKKDYHFSVVFVTERERFEVPVHAIGPRAILNFQDEIQFPMCLVKATMERTQQMINVGNSPAKFELTTQEPFSVVPSCGTLEIGESMQVVISFSPITKGEYNQDLLLHYHTGENVFASLRGTCEELDINLGTDSITLNKTYISLASIHKISLTNTSDSILHYCWSVWASQLEENLSLMRGSSVLQEMEEEVREQLLFQYKSDPTLIHRLPVLYRALQYGKGKTELDHLVLSHSCITLEPATGKIWPKMSQTFTIFFKPKKAKFYQGTIYCDITGHQSRLPLKFKGEGMGPKLQLSYNMMNMKNVFVGERNCYEVDVSNKGLIDAPFKLSCPNTTFGRCFSFNPDEAVIPFGGHQIVRIVFHSRTIGPFSEDLILTVKGQPKPLILTFRGCAVCPTFHFNLAELNFGDVAFGFPKTLTCTLFNTSFVPMYFSLRVLGDGLGSPSVTSAKQVSDMSKYNWKSCTTSEIYARPVEFTVIPAEDCVSALSDITIKVTLCSNTARTYKMTMAVDVEGVGEAIKSLPIYARCIVPEIVVKTPVLEFQRCFLNYPYEQQLQITNPSSLPACYGVLDQEYEYFPSITFFCSKPRGEILPQTSETLSVTIFAQATGWLQHILHIAVFGSGQTPVEVVLSCIGQGPLVHVHSSQLDYGKIPVLTDITKTLHLSNHSPIPANFATSMTNRKSFWHVVPSEGVVSPQSQLQLQVVANLKDTIKTQDELKVSIQDSETHTVSVSATGTGTSIVSDKPFAPSLDLGTHFSHGSCKYQFKLTNRGQRTHWMYWGVDGFLPKTWTQKGSSGLTSVAATSTPKKKDASSITSQKKEPVFSLTPSRVKLLPGCSVDMLLMGSSNTAKVVRERLVCRAVVGEQGCNEQIMTVDIICRFVKPLLSLSSWSLSFCLGKVVGENLTPMLEKVVLKNVSSLCVTAKFSLTEPFFLCESEEETTVTTMSMVLDDGKQAELWVGFHPDYCRDRVSRVVDKLLVVSYRGHPQKDMVQLHAEVHFPNLHFSTNVVDFGCVLNYTETHMVFTMTNCSQLPVTYLWAFLEDQALTERETAMHSEMFQDKQLEDENEETTSSSKSSSFTSEVELQSKPKEYEYEMTDCQVRVEEVFDILPMHGYLEPGEQQIVTVSFYGHEHIIRQVIAQCHVEEGPTYEIILKGEASVIKYSLNSAMD